MNKHIKEFIKFVKEDNKPEAYKALKKAIDTTKTEREQRIKANI